MNEAKISNTSTSDLSIAQFSRTHKFSVMDIVLPDFPSVQDSLAKLLRENEKLQQRIEKLEKQLLDLKYAPGGAVAKELEREFETLAKKQSEVEVQVFEHDPAECGLDCELCS
jgi:uncharacterized protein YlxW (UPF0749 family)